MARVEEGARGGWFGGTSGGWRAARARSAGAGAGGGGGRVQAGSVRVPPAGVSAPAVCAPTAISLTSSDRPPGRTAAGPAGGRTGTGPPSAAREYAPASGGSGDELLDLGVEGGAPASQRDLVFQPVLNRSPGIRRAFSRARASSPDLIMTAPDSGHEARRATATRPPDQPRGPGEGRRPPARRPPAGSPPSA